MSDNNLTWLVNYDHGYGNHNSPYDLQKNGKTAKEIAEVRIPIHNNTAAWHQRWIDHCANRLAYESAMLAESGGLAADKFDIQPGGQVQVRGAWFTVIRVNKKGGQVVSVTTNCKYVPVRGIEEVKDYTPPTEEVAEKAKKAAKGKSQLPICNYPIELPPLTGDRLKDAYSDKFKEITKAEWDALYKDSKGTVVFPANEKHGAHRVRTIWRAFKTYVYITDQKRVDPPPPDAVQEIVLRSDLPSEREIITRTPAPLPSEDDIAFKQMKESLKAGVQVVVANQLFPTPMELAERMVIEAEIKPGDRILEPSAGMGNILTAIIESHPDSKGDIRICEINYNLCKILGMNGAGYAVIGNDFMELEAHEAYQFDRILMNPPFADGQDIEHITKALLQHLAPGGRLVAICANGPRQNDHLKPLILQWGGTWEPLPADTFKSSGTGVNTVLIVVDRPEHKPLKVIEPEPVIEPVEVIKPVYKPVIQFIQES
jgi:phospholipid N-methyltransferase